MVQFRAPRRKNPFENPLAAALLHGLVAVAVVAGVGAWLAKGTFIPLIVVAVAVSLLEAAWLYFLLRK